MRAVLAQVSPTDFARRIRSRITGEWMYVFTPTIGGTRFYVKVVLRTECVVALFHEADTVSGDEEG